MTITAPNFEEFKVKLPRLVDKVRAFLQTQPEWADLPLCTLALNRLMTDLIIDSTKTQDEADMQVYMGTSLALKHVRLEFQRRGTLQ